jgi:hypothetical protein
MAETMTSISRRRHTLSTGEMMHGSVKGSDNSQPEKHLRWSEKRGRRVFFGRWLHCRISLLFVRMCVHDAGT